jgi:ABC-2 type transport system ATP-binding protein
MIQVKNLTKSYGQRTAVSDLTFDVKKGEVVGFLGPNGAGKSTTMKILTGFMPATSGTAMVNGFEVFQNPLEVKRSIGFLPEIPPVYLDMSVQEYVDFVCSLHKTPSDKKPGFIDNALEKTGLTHVRHRLIGNLSKGYRQRVGIAQAIAHNPQVLILDEPTVGLDPQQIIEIRQLIKGLANEHTVILSSHILPEVTATCQRVIIINKGKIVTEDTIDNLRTHSAKAHIFHLKVQNPKAEGIEAIRNLPEVVSVSEIKPSVLEVSMKHSTPETLGLITQTAFKHNMQVLEFSAHSLSLEEIFLELITVEKGA